MMTRGAPWLLAVLAAFSRCAEADPATVIATLRAEGCAGADAVGAPTRRDSVLDRAALELAGDAKLEEALARAGYPAASSNFIHLRGSTDDTEIRRFLAEHHCAAINDAKLEEVGVHQRGTDTWIVMASRTALPFTALRDPAAVADRALALVNEARKQARKCGNDSFEAAGPLAPSTTLAAAASLHALDMAATGRFAHDGTDGSSTGERITRAGYVWQGSGENLAAGQRDAETVVAGWLRSPGHCATLMNAAFTETGIAFALAPGKNPDVYWVQVFAAPR